MALLSTRSDPQPPSGELRDLVHRLNNDLQLAVGEAELLAERAHDLEAPIELRRDLALVLERLDAVGRVAVGIQHTVAALAASVDRGGGGRR